MNQSKLGIASEITPALVFFSFFQDDRKTEIY